MRRTAGGGEGGGRGGGEETDIKSNNPHLTGGEPGSFLRSHLIHPEMLFLNFSSVSRGTLSVVFKGEKARPTSAVDCLSWGMNFEELSFLFRHSFLRNSEETVT